MFLRDIRKGWKELAGNPLERYSAPFRIREDTLFVMAEHPAAAQEMQFQERRILKKINREFSLSLSRIRVTLGPLPRKEAFREPFRKEEKRNLFTSPEEICREKEAFSLSTENEELQRSLAELRAVYKKRFGK